MKFITARLAGAVVVGLGLYAGAASAEIDKLATYAQMRGIAGELQALRGNTAEQGRYTQLQSQFDALQASMGGDDPTRMYEAGARAAAAAKAVRAAPPAPTGMTIGTTTSTNSTPTAVADVGVITSTITIAGAGTYLWDVDVTTGLQHTFAADLDVTLTSPAGTVVTLTTDNGAGNDNIFDGTVWDDQGGTPTTDFVYANLTTATPLVPEEALGAFRGEDPNGTWTITISDDLSGDTGSLNSWTLDLFTLPIAPINTTATFSNATPTTINDVATNTSTITVSGAGTSLTALDLTTAIQHTFAADMDITLTSPAGTVVTLSTDNGAGNDNVFDGTNWDDDANPAGQVPYTTNNGVATDNAYVNLTAATPLVVEEALSAFMGEDPNGVWTLTIVDDLTGDTGTLNSWSLDVTTGVGCATLTCPANVTVGNAAGTCGAIVNYPAPTADAACGTVTCVAASGSTFGVGANTVTCTTAVGNLSCNFSVTVNDAEAPVVICPADIALDQIPGQATLPVTYPAPTVSDNCPGATAACNPASGSPYSVGTTATTCTATDAAANTAACAFNVTVGAFIPNTPIPSLSLAGVLLLALLVIGLAFPGRR
ncbi:MAG TPA: proprotein convertase P-domain-containing protein [Pseudomonadota bacterium]|nr:proprotein convertase P-domain-containing protein [Pseudomonadota bacterium]